MGKINSSLSNFLSNISKSKVNYKPKDYQSNDLKNSIKKVKVINTANILNQSSVIKNLNEKLKEILSSGHFDNNYTENTI